MRYIDEVLTNIESDLSIQSRDDIYREIKKLGICDFGLILMNMPDERFPRLTSMLPKFASEQVQKDWTGAHGHVLLGQSLNFMRSLSENYARLTGSSLDGKNILDFGCGYGRLLRLALFYSKNVYGVDPWDRSVKICNEAGLVDKIFVSDYLPEVLPLPKIFDLVYAFSVFTHLSERAALTCLRTLRNYVVENGLMCITIRPIEYWRTVYPNWPETLLAQKEFQHSRGFAFEPHNREKIDGDITYGDTSMTIEWLAFHCGKIGWQIEAFDRSLDDSLQRYVFLRRI